MGEAGEENAVGDFDNMRVTRIYDYFKYLDAAYGLFELRFLGLYVCGWVITLTTARI